MVLVSPPGFLHSDFKSVDVFYLGAVMRVKFGCLVLVLLFSAGQQAHGQEVQTTLQAGNQHISKTRPAHQSPRSLFDMFGVRANTTPDLEWQAKYVKDITSIPTPFAPAPLIASNTDISGGPAGRVDMFVFRNNPTNDCVTAALYNGNPTGWSTVFDKTFNTGPGSSYLRVTYTAQAVLDDGGVGGFDGIALQILVTQGLTTVACSNTDRLPYLLTRSYDGKGNKVLTTYSGYVAVDPNVNTRLQIQVAVGVSGTVGQVCDNNLIISY